MIKGITSSGKYVIATGGNNSGPYISPGSAGAGMMRWNSNMNQIEVNDGNVWIPVPTSYATVGITPEAESLLDWAKEKRNEEVKLEAMMKKYPALKKAKENFDLLLNIVKDDYHENS